MEPPATRSVCGVRAAFPEAWQRGSWHCPFATATIIKKTTFNHGPLSASHSNLMYFSSLSERSGRRRPPAERSAVYTNNTTDSSTIVNGTGGCLLVPGERRFLWSRSWGLNLLGSGRTTYYCFSYHLAGCSQSLHLNSGDVGGRGVVIQTSAVVCSRARPCIALRTSTSVDTQDLLLLEQPVLPAAVYSGNKPHYKCITLMDETTAGVLLSYQVLDYSSNKHIIPVCSRDRARGARGTW